MDTAYGNAYENLLRLPGNIIPESYEIYLNPNLNEATFKGTVTIKANVVEATPDIILNGHGLEVLSVRVIMGDNITGENECAPHYITIQPKSQVIALRMEKTLEIGQYMMQIRFCGKLSSETVGFYRSTTSDIGLPPKYCALTYFEPTYARFAFPCFDEPHLKATFKFTLVRPSSHEYRALSNGEVEKEVVDSPVDGQTTVFFSKTKPMSTYLTGIFIGEFDRLDPVRSQRGSIPISVFIRPLLVQHTAYSRDLARKVLDFYAEYFDINYSFPKLDLVAIPNAKINGMENWSVISLRESAVLIEKEESSTSDYLDVTKIISHELAHMWFGNLVTMKWWDELWLKEGMADFIANICCQQVVKSWFGEWVFIDYQTLPVLKVDACDSSHPIFQPVTHPNQIREIFDHISYKKGSCIFRMVHNLGEKPFRESLQKYLKKFSYSVATTKDLLDCFDECFGWNLSDKLGPWIFQQGFPVVSVMDTPEAYILRQAPFRMDLSKQPSSVKWDIPLKYFFGDNKNEILLTWLNPSDDSLTIKKPTPESWIKVNSHFVGYYRVNYSSDMWIMFADLLMKDPHIFDAEDRVSLISDAFSLAYSGYLDYGVPLNLILYLKNGKEDNFLVWKLVCDHLKIVQNILKCTGILDYFKRYLDNILKALYPNLKWTASEEIPFLERKLRMEQINTACTLGCEEALKQVRIIFKSWMESVSYKLSPDIKFVMFSYGLSGTDCVELWELCWTIYLRESHPKLVILLLKVLASTPSTSLLVKLLNEAKNPDVIKSENFFTLLALISKNPVGNPLVWNFIKTEWPYFISRFTINDHSLGSIVSEVTSNFCCEQKLKEVKDFFEKYPDAGASTFSRKHTIEAIKENINWQLRHYDSISKYLISICSKSSTY